MHASLLFQTSATLTFVRCRRGTLGLGLGFARLAGRGTVANEFNVNSNSTSTAIQYLHSNREHVVMLMAKHGVAIGFQNGSYDAALALF